MYIQKSSLDNRFLKDINFLEKKYNIIITLEYVKETCIAHCYSVELMLMEVATITVGDRSETKERWYVRLSKELKRIFS